jgi:DNA polymerase-3 subunit delta
VSEEAREFAVARFSLKRSPLEEVLAQARILPMLSPRHVVVVTDIDALTEAGLSALEDYLAVPVDSTVLVFEAARLDRRTRAARLLLDRCEVHEAESPDDWGAVAAAARMADGLGVRLDRETAEELVFALGNDQGRLHGELRKLRAYAGPEAQVAPADVAAIVSSARQFSVFELADLLAERRRSDALARLRRLLEAGENPIGIVGLLAWLYRQLLVAQGMPKNTPVWKAAQALRAPRSRVEALVRQAQRFSRQQLSAGLAALCEADVSLKSSPASQEAVLEMLIVRLTETPERVGAATANN